MLPFLSFVSSVVFICKNKYKEKKFKFLSKYRNGATI
jgi:hypothetical protein